MQTECILQQECQYLNIKAQTETSYRQYSVLIWMQGTHECIIHANPAIEWGDLATLARGMHVRKSLVSYP